MRLKTVSGKSFRNYSVFNFSPHPGLNIFTGRNAQGKSNLIEALYVLMRGFSYRASRQSEVIAWNRPGAELKGTLQTASAEVGVGFSLGPDGRRSTLDGETVSRSVLASQLGLVLFTPEDLCLIKGGPQHRRRFVDMELGLLRPGYWDDLQAYRRALAQRNALLRQTAPREGFDLWTEQLARYGARVVLARLEILRRMASEVSALYKKWAETETTAEELSLRYLSAVELPGLSKDDIGAALRGALETALPRDLRTGQTTVGPHRDELLFLLNGRQARLFASQGQQRSIILALKMAQLTLWHERLGLQPLVLLDDVLYELDAGRRERLLIYLRSQGQTFITVNDASSTAGFGDRVFHVLEGKVRQKGEE